MTCKRCGCTEQTPCVRDGVPCAWQLPDLCTYCLTPEEAAIDRSYAGIIASLRDEQLYHRCALAVAQGMAASGDQVVDPKAWASHVCDLALALHEEMAIGVPDDHDEDDEDPADRLIVPGRS